MLDANDLRTLLAENPITATKFRGVYASDRIPVRADANALYVFNTDPSNEPGEHWVVVFFDDNLRAEYFDSFGLHPIVKTFLRFLTRNSASWRCNVATVQHPLSDACGYHCVYYSVYRCAGFELDSIIDTYTDDLSVNDELVKSFVRKRL